MRCRSSATQTSLSCCCRQALVFLFAFGAIPALLFLAPAQAAAQSTALSNGSEYKAPSRLRAAERQGEVLLTWRDSETYTGSYRVWRSTEAFEAGPLARTAGVFLSGTVDSGIEALIDRPEQPGVYYYAVTADEANPQLIEQRNFLPRPVRVVEIAERAQAPAEVGALSVRSEEQVAVLSFVASRHGRRLAVFASTEPFETTADLERAVRLSVIDSDRNEYRDYPVPGVPTYYAVLDAELAISGTAHIAPGHNASTEALRIPLGTARTGAGAPRVGARREAPIPVLRMPWLPTSGYSALDLSRSPAQLNPETQAALDAMLLSYGVPAPAPPEPLILPGDRLPAGTGAATGTPNSLTTVLSGPFSRMEWEDAEFQLTNLLTTIASLGQRARVQFYRGQSLYFLGRFNEASLAFVDAREHLYPESLPWLDASLRAAETARRTQ